MGIKKNLTVGVDSLDFRLSRGWFEEEKKVENHFIVSVYVSIKTDFISELEDTLDYGALVEIVKKSMYKKWSLLEEPAEKITDEIFDKYTEAQKIKVQIKKLAPPFSGVSVASAFVELESKRK